MKHVFAVTALLLVAASFVTARLHRATKPDVPVLTWCTDDNPARREQAALLRPWLQKHGHPDFTVQIDIANGDDSKKVIQGVSGVGDDLIDMGDDKLPYFQSMGLLTDITSVAATLGFGVPQVYPAMLPQITVKTGSDDPRQYGYPANVWCHLLLVNREVFERHHLSPPPERWDLDQFEEIGRKFVAAANKGGRQEVFFVADLDMEILRRSFGLSMFNETLTRCTLDDPRYVALLERYHRWIYVDHLLPSDAELQSIAAATGYGGQTLQLFAAGKFAMVRYGRFALIPMRQFPEMSLSCSEPPNGGFPNTLAGARVTAVYSGSHRGDLANLFLAFLASEEYNRQIARDADGQPPNPLFANDLELLQPPTRRNEWPVHEAFSRAMSSIAIAGIYSPFVLPNVASRIDGQQRSLFLNGLISAANAAKETERLINQEIERTLAEDPRLRQRHEQLLLRQKQIDELRAKGQPIPAELIENPFYRRYYAEKGGLR